MRDFWPIKVPLLYSYAKARIMYHYCFSAPLYSHPAPLRSLSSPICSSYLLIIPHIPKLVIHEPRERMNTKEEGRQLFSPNIDLQS